MHFSLALTILSAYDANAKPQNAVYQKYGKYARKEIIKTFIRYYN